MDIQFSPVSFSDIREAVQSHLAALPARIDSFLEEHILASHHYHIFIARQSAGFASIHGESLLTQFSLTDQHKRYGQAVFQQLRKLEHVESAFVPTCDEFFLAHALDDYRQLTKQAYFFNVVPHTQDHTATQSFSLRLANPEDIPFIQQYAGEFFTPVEKHLAAHTLFLVRSSDEYVGFGLIESSSLYGDVASIGMYTIEHFRHIGIATATITLLIEECRRRELHPIAGCWYYNHVSKKTLERAGMFTQTRLLKIDY
ncbi:GNAT family N-acetyltransferase [Nostoc sp.]|uniref:GNAT family N-acetyltransferase n=1 Tax=Nostoc sp. TaxID=1180 RepID=UPI002FFBE68B